MTHELVSIVLPVYNEDENIQECLRRLSQALGGLDYEILVCYDFDEDTTLGAVARMDTPPATVRFVKNTIGPGVANAIKAGFKAATGDVIVTTMADLSDPPEVIPAMVEKIRAEGADVVSASRYMKGGSQTGGPLLKRLLSRTAGLSLHWLTGLATHDATNNFRAYSRTFLENTAMESDKGFEVALELTVKAHLAGFKVAEVASTWVDRSAGQSRFRMWRWMPRYLKWYIRAMAAPAFVWGVLAVTLAAAFYMVGHYGRDIPWWDEWKNVPYVTGREPVTASWIWHQHNEHRIPIPKIVYVLLVDASGGDFRAPKVFNTLGLGVVAFAFIICARNIRGRMSFTDAFFPLAWLHWAHSETMLWGFQVQFVLSTALFSAILMSIAGFKGSLKPPRALLVGGCLVLLPLCGAQGLVLVPALLVWLLYAAFCSLRSAEPPAKRAGYVMLASVALAAAVGVLYFVGLDVTRGMRLHPTLREFLRTSLEFLSVSFGPAAKLTWRWSGYVTAFLYVFLGLFLVRVALARREERLRATGFLAVLISLGLLAASIGWGRAINGPQVGFANRYVAISLPFVCLVYLVFVHYRHSRLLRYVPLVLFAVALVSFPYNCNYDRWTFYRWRRWESDRFRHDVLAGMSSADLAHKYWEAFYRDQDEALLAEQIEVLRKARLGPFRGKSKQQSR